MVFHGFSWFQVGFSWFFMVSHGSRLVFHVFSQFFMVLGWFLIVPRLVFHGFFHGFSWCLMVLMVPG